MKTFPLPDEFHKKLEPELYRIHPGLRPTFSIRAYELALLKSKMERRREDNEVDAAKKHDSAERYQLVLTQLRKAVASLRLAQEPITAEDGDLLKNVGVERAEQILLTAKSHLEWMVDGAPAGKAPGPKWLKDTLVTPSSPEQPKEPVLESGFAKIDYWFIGELDKLFDFMLPPKPQIGNFGRDRIIQKIFQIAFSEFHELSRIKGARNQEKKRRS
jgi:hypothetical protein